MKGAITDLARAQRRGLAQELGSAWMGERQIARARRACPHLAALAEGVRGYMRQAVKGLRAELDRLPVGVRYV